jgi:hypothetical protein
MANYAGGRSAAPTEIGSSGADFRSLRLSRNAFSMLVIPGLDPGIPGDGRVKPGHDE